MEEPERENFGDFFTGGGGGGGPGGYADFSEDTPLGGGPPPQGGGGGFRGRGGPPWRGRGRGGMGFDNGQWPRGPPPRGFRGRGGFMGGPPMGMRGPRGFRGGGGHFGERPFRPPPHGGNWNNSPQFHHMQGQGPPENEHVGQGPQGQGQSQGPEPVDKEVWAETKTESGASYYYNTKTRVTSWDRPEGPNVTVISHEEYSGGSKGGDESSPSAGFGAQGPPQGVNPFGYKPEAENGIKEKVDASVIHGPRPTGPLNLPPAGFPPFSSPPPFSVNPALQFPQHFMTPPPGHAHAGHWNPMSGLPNPAGVPAPVINPMDPLLPHIDPAVVAKALEWTEHLAPDGKIYYHNPKTQASVWEKPSAFIEFETAKMIAQQRLMAQTLAAAKENEHGMDTKAKAHHKAAVGDKMKPVSSTPVSGTPWCVVWTGDKRVFFYNPSTKSSVWERPPELIGRMDVEELLRVCPAVKPTPNQTGPIKKAEATSSTTEIQALAAKAAALAAAAIAANAEKERAASAATADAKIIIQSEKREHEEGEETGEEPPEKKAKKETSSDGEGGTEVIQLSDDSNDKKNQISENNALEAEVKAAKERATVPLEIRLQQFKEMMVEKEVSAFSTWEKELHKIVFDSRYLLLTSKERKAAFDDYVKERAQEERKEKKARANEIKEAFMKFLEEARVHVKMGFHEFSQKYGRDDRYRAIDKSRDRESYFQEFISELKRKEKDAKRMEREKIKDEFTSLLKDKIKDYHLHWADVKKRIDEPRFDCLSFDEKEDLFRSFQKKLKADTKYKEKKRKKKLKKEKRDKKAKAEKEKKEGTETENTKTDESGIEVENVITAEGSSEAAGTEKEEAGNGVTAAAVDGETPTTDTGEGSDDKMDDVSEDEEEEGAISDDSDEEDRIKKEKAENSIREREKEVQRALATHLRDRDKEREFYRREEALQEFQSVLTDLVRSSDAMWKDAKKSIKKDHRWDSVSVLSREEMEDLFNQHVENVAKKKKLRLRDLLQEARVKLDSNWKDVRRKLRNDPRFQKYSNDDRKCEREFHTYLKDLETSMKSDFRNLLKETKMLTYKSKQQIRENPQAMKTIESVLEKDKRFLNLECIADDRYRLIAEYLEELERKGPPPPPTASDKVNRRK